MKKTIINIKTDKEVKESAKKTARELGISLSDVVNAGLRNFIRTRRIIFSAVPQMTPELEKILGKTEVDIRQSKNLSPALSSASEIEKYLNSLE